MKKENENRLGLTGQTGQERKSSVASTEWPAEPVPFVRVADGKGAMVEISFREYLLRLKTNNRGGT